MARAFGLVASTFVVVFVSVPSFAPARVAGLGDRVGVARVSSGPSRVYDSDAAHLWNRLYAALYERTARDGRLFGRDELDPLLWDETEHLLVGPSHTRALERLDEFVAKHGERLVADPLRRVMLQRDLWAVFDWTARRERDHAPEAAALQSRLAVAIRRLALSRAEIGRLPDTYASAVRSGEFSPEFNPNRPADPFLPPDLFQKDGPWVYVSAVGSATSAPAHAARFSRSSFAVFMRLPAGRDATRDYLKRVAEFPDPWLPDPSLPGQLMPNVRLPQFPVGTQVALVRRMLVVDDAGTLVPTSIVESVQLRVHRVIGDRLLGGFPSDSPEPHTAIAKVEVDLSRERLFAARAGGLRAVEIDTLELPTFGDHGWDAFEMESGEPERFMNMPLKGCASCHFEPGIHSVLSRGSTALVAYDVTGEARALGASASKRTRYDWGLLRGLWRQSDRARSEDDRSSDEIRDR